MDDPKRDDFRRLDTAVRGGRVAHTRFLEPDEADRLASRLRSAGAQVEADGGVTGAKRRVLTAFPEHIPAANTPLAALYVEGAPSEGDLLAALAGLLYTGYLIFVERTRATLPPLPLLIVASLFGAAMLLPTALIAREQVIPADWTALFALALCSQVLGQGLLVYALGHVPPLIVGVAMLTQPALSALLGYVYYDEALTSLDWLGAILIVTALILVRLRGARREATLA